MLSQIHAQTHFFLFKYMCWCKGETKRVQELTAGNWATSFLNLPEMLSNAWKGSARFWEGQETLSKLDRQTSNVDQNQRETLKGTEKQK